MCDVKFNKKCFCFRNNVFIMSFFIENSENEKLKMAKWHQNRIARLFFRNGGQLCSKKGQICYFEVNCAEYRVV